MFDGIEVDVLSLKDADSIVITQWVNSFPLRILVDGGRGADGETALEFLRGRGYTVLWAVVCTHLHNDHARGLIKVVRDRSIIICNGWMHDIRRHLDTGTLRRAAAANDEVKEVLDNTAELTRAFAERGIAPQEPFAGSTVAWLPSATVLGPSKSFYRRALEDFTKVELPPVPPLPSFQPGARSGFVPWSPSPLYRSLGLLAPPPSAPISGYLSSLISSAPAPPPSAPTYRNLASLISAVPAPPVLPPLPPLTGALTKSSVKENPTTQPFNDTSVILGVTFNGYKLLFTGDAGSDALAWVPAQWNHLLYMGVPHHGSDGNLSQRDIERFCPQLAVVSACGDSSHPSRAIVSGLVKVGTKVYSTHSSGNLWFWSGTVPVRTDYGPVEALKGTGSPEPVVDWSKLYSLGS